ncbi:MAG: tRNA 2-thiouridine(34) synthase MnmA [Cyanobacteriota bacterium]|nr:tRNA 2-thiouridine(34) synthase MnmA [Cyanobacteriota bacterium]
MVKQRSGGRPLGAIGAAADARLAFALHHGDAGAPFSPVPDPPGAMTIPFAPLAAPSVPSVPSVASGGGARTPAGAATLERLRHWPGDHQVVVGLSGGVDSSLTAALLVEAGWRVEGLTLWLMSGKGACCAEGLVDAAAICEQLAIPHHLLDFRAHFQEQIVAFLVEGYGAGLTPLPCSRCNRAVKFGPMLAWARGERRIGRLATGHYARVRHAEGGDPLPVPGDGGGRHQLLRGLDRHKDQSYFLYDLPQEVLGSLVFPLGEMAKGDTRLEAARLGLRTAAKPESQDLCLADHHGSMKAFLDAHLPPRQGEIVLADGSVVGHHDGIEHFTIGQRRGLGVAWSEPLHVVRLDGALNRVVVAPRREATRQSCQVGAVNWVSMARPRQPLQVEVQVRYRTAPEPATLVPLEGPAGGEVRLDFTEPQFSITPGQAAVFYAGEVLLGGGLIQP